VIKQRPFIQCDVFTAEPTRGNALAVVLDGQGLTDEQMQQFAAWTNLAETTFLLPPTQAQADYAVRIFTPTREMLFAGHPTLGSCASWMHHGGVPKNADVVRQECAVGIIDIHLTGEVPAFTAPPTKIQPLPQNTADALAQKLGIASTSIINTAFLDNGPQWQVFELASADDVLSADSSAVNFSEDKPVGLIGPHAPGGECDFEVRMMASSGGMSEDPITGSLNAALAHWMLSDGRLISNVVVAQGTKIGRSGRVYISPDQSVDGSVRIGGQTHILIEGTVQL